MTLSKTVYKVNSGLGEFEKKTNNLTSPQYTGTSIDIESLLRLLGILKIDKIKEVTCKWEHLMTSSETPYDFPSENYVKVS